ncbi:MAG: hypothetical protein K2X93_19245 [Candidatus Obscuribacterales bacterium]|nr:hypothetical protein [Candidatus Obscuribacterales bacterium]
MIGKNNIISLLLITFLVAQFLSIGNAFTVISLAGYDDIEDIYDIEKIVTLDPFLASSKSECSEESIASAIQIILLCVQVFRLDVSHRQQPATCGHQRPRLCQDGTRLWLKNRAILL